MRLEVVGRGEERPVPGLCLQLIEHRAEQLRIGKILRPFLVRRGAQVFVEQVVPAQCRVEAQCFDHVVEECLLRQEEQAVVLMRAQHVGKAGARYRGNLAGNIALADAGAILVESIDFLVARRQLPAQAAERGCCMVVVVAHHQRSTGKSIQVRHQVGIGSAVAAHPACRHAFGKKDNDVGARRQTGDHVLGKALLVDGAP